MSITLGLLLALVFNELSFQFLRSDETRSPQVIELVIPPGTAEQVAQGNDSLLLPTTMTFVVGDVLLVHNNDRVNHQLGPMFIPAGSSASLTFDTIQHYAYVCSFQTERYLGLDVRQPLTLGIRLLGTLFAGLPLGALIAIYSLGARPLTPKNNLQTQPES